jgi:hypothetical protein
MQQCLEPLERVAIVEDDSAERTAVDLAVRPDDAVAEVSDERRLHLVATQQVMDDLVARDGRRAVARERSQRLTLPRPDAARDRDG